MAGRKPGTMQTKRTREKIQATQIVNRLYKCVLGEVEMSPQQVNAAKTLLNKVLPDLSSIDSSVTVKDERQITEYSTAELLALRDQLSTATESGSEGESTQVH